LQGDRIDIGYIRDRIVIGQLKERGDWMKIVISVDGRRTLDFTDVGDKAYIMETKDHKGETLSNVRISKEDIKRLAKAT